MFCIFLILVLNCHVLSAPNECPAVCSCDGHQHIISCRRGQLDRIPWNLPDPKELLELDTSDNDIRDLTASVFLFPRLKMLNLNSNKVERIDQGSFSTLDNLRILLLHGNRLRHLPSDGFQGLQSLFELDLGSNEIETVDEDAFSNLIQLEKLNLRKNRINRLEPNTFRSLGNLRYVTLSDNLLLHFPSFDGLFSVNSIYLDMNRIKSIPQNVLNSASKVQILSLDGNLISYIADDAFGDDADGRARIERLSLRNNCLVQVPQKAIGSLQDLQVLDLSGNLMEFLTDSDFRELFRLETLTLSSMPRLIGIRNGTFSTNTALRELTITSNDQLSYIEPGCFGASNNLRRFDLHGNLLSSLDRGIINWNSLDFVDLRFNRWFCDCRLQWLHRKIKTMSSNETQFHLLDTKCSQPSHLFSRRIIDLDEADFVCVAEKTPEQLQRENEDKILFGLLGGICSVLFVIMLFVLFKCRSSFINPSSGTYPYAAYVYPSFQHPDIHPNNESQSGRRFRAIRANQEISRPHESSENLTNRSAEIVREKKSEVRFNLDDVEAAERPSEA